MCLHAAHPGGGEPPPGPVAGARGGGVDEDAMLLPPVAGAGGGGDEVPSDDGESGSDSEAIAPPDGGDQLGGARGADMLLRVQRQRRRSQGNRQVDWRLDGEVGRRRIYNGVPRLVSNETDRRELGGSAGEKEERCITAACAHV